MNFFRNDRFVPQIGKLVDRVVELSRSQEGSRLIQLRLEWGSSTEKEMIFTEIMTAPRVLMTDPFGNYVIQKLFECGTSEQKAELISNVNEFKKLQ